MASGVTGITSFGAHCQPLVRAECLPLLVEDVFVLVRPDHCALQQPLFPPLDLPIQCILGHYLNRLRVE